MNNDLLLSVKQSRTKFWRLVTGKTIGTLAYGFLLILLIQPLRTSNPSLITFLSILMCVVFLSILIWRLRRSLSGWFWEIKITPDLLYCQTLDQNPTIIHQKDVNRVDGKGLGGVIGTSFQQLHLNLHALPLKEGVILIHVIGNWAPRSIFPPQTQIELLQRENDDEAIHLMKNASQTAHNNQISRWGIRVLALSIGLGFVSLFVWLGTQGALEFQTGIITTIAALLIIGLPFSLLFSVWLLSVKAKILVDHTGITWIHGKQHNRFPWENITAIYIKLSEPVTVIHVWEESKKGKKLILSHFQKDNKFLIFDTINKQTFARSIPFNLG